MASSNTGYAAIPHNNLTSTLTPSPTLPELPHTPLSAAFEDLAGFIDFDGPAAKHASSVSDVLRSLTGSQPSTQSYELVEEDDYDQSQITPRLPKKMSEHMENDRPSSPMDDTPVRTASISRHLPLHNPTPDLQSLQGAYLKNVQALEDSAERISLGEGMEEELKKMRQELRRIESKSSRGSAVAGKNFSSNSMVNSIIGVNAEARSGGYSPAGYVGSPIGSVRSQRAFSHRAAGTSRASNPLPEPELEGRPLESAMVHSPPAHAMQPRQSTESHRSHSQASHDRPGTSASNDTYRQAQNLFTDFDGVHFAPLEEGDFMSRHVSLSHPPLARDSRVFSEPQPDHNMVYYPAPVPVMLNLPKRLSKHNWAQEEKRRTQVLSGIPQDMRKSAVWLANEDSDAEYAEELQRPRNRMSALPPQLRASAFFDAPGTQTDVKLKHGSAVITLDSILDAAAHAPVSAFVDHPIAGHVGQEVYGVELGHRKKSSEIKKKRRSSLSNMLTKRKSSATLSGARRQSQNLDNEVEVPDDDPERAGEKSLAPDADELVDGEKQEGEHSSDEEAGGEEDQESQHQLGFLGAPTTLLAELQMRKAQQKLRNTSASNVAPGGMHSTLLELDAVRQLQQKARKQKHVALAWEDHEAVDKANFDDEDVPLGVLFPEKGRQTHVNLNRPMGLMEKKELEENEPLSFRRARLRGEPYKPPVAAQPSPMVVDPIPAVRSAGVDDHEEEENEGETLAERRKRIQEKQGRRASLADDIASHLGLDPETYGGTKTPEPELEETLGQRRQRLQAETEKNIAPLKAKTSMGDLLRANPVGSRNGSRQASAESKVSSPMDRRSPNMPLVSHIQAAQPGSKALPTPQANPPPYFPNQPLQQHHQQQQQMFYPPQPVMGQPQYTGFPMPQFPQMQSMPNLNLPNMNYNGSSPQQNLYMQNNMSNMSLGVNNMMYNPMQMNMMGMSGMPMAVGAYAAPGYDAIGMGPPLTGQQRASIDRWRQGIA